MKKLLIIIGSVVCVALGFGLSCWLKPHNTCPSTGERDMIWTPRRENLEFVDRVVDAYDIFISSRISEDIAVEEAYMQFFAGIPEIESAGDVGKFMYDSVYLYSLMHGIISGRWEYNGLIAAKYNGPTRQTPAVWSIYPEREMLPLLRMIAKENPHWQEVADSFEAAGDFSPSVTAGLLHTYDKVDFSNKFERFVVAAIYMPAYMSDNSFVIPADKHKNDSIRKILDEKYDNTRTD